MNLLVVGCGRVGTRLVQTMEYLGHDVAVVEEKASMLEKLAELSPPFTGMAVRGVPIDIDVLRSAGIEACDAVAAVTQDDNINIMVAQMAKEVFHIKNVIARITDPYAKEIFSERFAMRTVCGTNLTAQAFVAGLLYGTAEEDMRRIGFGSSTANFTTVKVSADQVNKPLLSIGCPHESMMLFGVWRANGTMELANNPQILVHTDDRLVYAKVVD